MMQEAKRQVSARVSVRVSTESEHREKHIRALEVGEELRAELHDSLALVSLKTKLW